MATVVGVGVSAILIFVFALLLLLILRLKLPAFSRVKPLKKRVVVMRSNVLYPNSRKDPNCQWSQAPLLPQVKIECGRGRLESDLTFASEYEIPLDKEWEFSRNKLVFVE